MSVTSNPQKVQSESGVATAEQGHVILDGPDGIAVTMTASAALETGQNLISAAEIAISQSLRGDEEQGGA